MNPATLALLDQADAATTQSLGALYNAAEHLAALPAGPISRAMIERFRQRALTGTLGACDHLKPTAPKPAFWMPWAPGKIRCAHCTMRVYERVKGTAEDNRCDHCRRSTVVMNTVCVQIPAFVFTVGDLPPVSTPPVQVHFGLCNPCRQADQSPPPTQGA